METVADALLEQIWNTLWGPQLLPESFTFEGKLYSIGCERADDGGPVKFFAYLEFEQAAALELKPQG